MTLAGYALARWPGPRVRYKFAAAMREFVARVVGVGCAGQFGEWSSFAESAAGAVY